MESQSTPQSPPPESNPPDWRDLGLSQPALDLISQAGYLRPTPVQAESIPLALAKNDLIASAQTGTGKTASFVLPMVERFANKEGTFGLILAPTREIAQQTQAAIEVFGAPRGIRSIALIGGIDMKIDAQAIQTYPQIIVATPGRLCDHLDRGNIWLDFIQMVVLDEADRMLDMGFADQLARIFNDLPKERQTMVFSATFPPSVERLAKKIMNHPKRVAIGRPVGSSASNVEQRILFLKEENKNQQLNRLLREEPGSIIVFTRSKDGATRVWRSLHSRGVYDATYIHSDRLQAHREQALAEFKEGKYRILIATDVAGRGIHVDDVAHVVNYDLPLEPEDYIHRIGRTGRKGASGRATSFVTPRDRALLQSIERLLGRRIPENFAGENNAAEKTESATQNIAQNAEAPAPGENQNSGKPRKPRGHRRGGRRGNSQSAAREAGIGVGAGTRTGAGAGAGAGGHENTAPHEEQPPQNEAQESNGTPRPSGQRRRRRRGRRGGGGSAGN